MTRPSPSPPIYPEYCHSLSPTISRWCPLRAIDVYALQSVGMSHNGRELYHYVNHPVKWVRLTGVVVAIDEFPERRLITIDDSSGACIECVCAVPASEKDKAGLERLSSHLNPMPAAAFTKPSTCTASGTTRISSGGDKAVSLSADARGAESAAALHLLAKRDPCVRNPVVPWRLVDIGSVLKVKGQVGQFRGVKQVDVIKIDVVRGTEAEVKCWEEAIAFRRGVLSKVWVVTQEEEDKCRDKVERERRRREKGRSRLKSRDGKGGREGGMSVGSRREEEEGGKKTGERRKEKKRDVVGKENHQSRRKEAESKEEVEEERRRRHKERKRKKDSDRECEALEPPSRPSLPSTAVRRRIAGKYDALGI